MLKIRLQRKGAKKKPIYHVVVVDSRKARDGKVIERIGWLDVVNHAFDVKLNWKRAEYWLSQGGQPTKTAKDILKKEGLYYRQHLRRWGKPEEEIEQTISVWKQEKRQHLSVAKGKKNQQQSFLELEEKSYQEKLKEILKQEKEQQKEEKSKGNISIDNDVDSDKQKDHEVTSPSQKQDLEDSQIQSRDLLSEEKN